MHNDRLWVIGGRDGTDYYDDVWWSADDGKTWNKVEKAADPADRFSARSGHQVVAHDDKLWVIGGWDSADHYDDVWWSADDGKTWNKVEKAAGSMRFSERSNHQVVAHDNRLWVIGGDDDTDHYYSDVWWSVDGADWTKVDEPTDNSRSRFSARHIHQVVAHNNRLWVIGGWDGSDNNDVWWSHDGVTWTEATNNARFSPREEHQVVTYNNRLWVIGGGSDGARKNDVWWSVDGVTWIEVPPEERGIEHFSARNSHQVVVHNDELWLIGGWDGNNAKNDVWRSKDGVTWTQVRHTGTRFSGRSGHQVVVHNDELWLIGGWDGSLRDDVWRSQDGENWSKVDPTDTSKPRFAPQNKHQVVTHNDWLWLIGVWDWTHNTNIWRSQDGADWTKVEPTDNSTPWPRSNTHQLVAHNNRLWVFGGSRDIPNNADILNNAVWSSENGVTWTELKATTDPRFSGRKNHRVVVHNNRLWVTGGYDGARKNDVWRSEDGENWRQGFHGVFLARIG